MLHLNKISIKICRKSSEGDPLNKRFVASTKLNTAQWGISHLSVAASLSVFTDDNRYWLTNNCIAILIWMEWTINWLQFAYIFDRSIEVIVETSLTGVGFARSFCLSNFQIDNRRNIGYSLVVFAVRQQSQSNWANTSSRGSHSKNIVNCLQFDNVIGSTPEWMRFTSDLFQSKSMKRITNR